MVGDVAVSRRFPGRSQRRKNFARFCFDRRVPALTQLEDSSWISSRRGSLCRHCGNRDSFAGRVFPLPDRLLHGPRYTPASLLTSVSFFLLATGILLAPADRGTLAIIVSETAAGMLARRLIPLAILLPILIGALRQTAERAGLYDPTFGAAHSATTFM